MASKKLLALAIAGLMALGGCGGDKPAADNAKGGNDKAATPVPPQKVTVTVTDKAVDFAKSLESEPVTIVVDNQSKAKKPLVAFGRINDGVSQAQIEKELKKKESDFKIFRVAGGIQPPNKQVTALLPEGNYFIGAVEELEIKPAFFTVGPASGDPVAEPESQASIEVGEYYFKPDGAFKSGDVSVVISNAGEQSHMVGIGFGHKEVGFTLAPAPGGKIWTTLHFAKSGKYDLVCYFPDVKTGKPHIKLGMKDTLKVAK